MKLNNEIFSDAVAVLGARKLSLQKIFNYEQHFFAPAISDYGELHLPPKKSDLVYEIIKPCHNPPSESSRVFDPTSTIVLDGTRVINQFAPNPAMTFMDYTNYLYTNVISLYFKFHQRLDIVFETYVDKSLKAATHQKRGRAVR